MKQGKRTSYRKNPREAWKIPAKKVEVKASWRNKTGSLAGETSCISIDPIISEAIETGPTARSLELPKIAYNKGGTKLESATKFVTVMSHFSVSQWVLANYIEIPINNQIITHKDPQWQVDWPA